MYKWLDAREVIQDRLHFKNVLQWKGWWVQCLVHNRFLNILAEETNEYLSSERD